MVGKNSVIFTLGNYNLEPDATINSVVFQYGTALDEPQFTGHQAPEPSGIVMAALAIFGLGWFGRRRRRG